jgi:hypothetical protein
VTHIGLYLGKGRRTGRRWVISALINPWGVTRHLLDRITVPVYGYGLVTYPDEEES